MKTVIKAQKQRAQKPPKLPRWQEAFLQNRYTKPALFIAIFVLIGLGILFYTRASTTSVKNGVGLCLDNPGGSTSRGHTTVLWTCHGGLNQQWQVGTDRTVRVQGLCLDDPGGSTANGTAPVMWSCHAGTNQQWVAQTDGTLKNVYANLCLDDPMASRNAGTVPVLWACHGGINQQWSLPGAATIASAISGVGNKCVDVRYNEHTQGNTVWLWACNNGPAQQWSLSGDGTIRNQNWCLDTKDGAKTAQTLVELSSCSAAATQQWTPQGNGTIKNVASGLCLDDQWAATTDGNPLWIWPCDGNVAQVWTLGTPASGGSGGPVPPPGPPAPPPPPPPPSFDPTARIFTGDYETGSLSQWETCQSIAINSACSGYANNHYSLRAVSDVRRQGRYAARFELHDGDIPFGGTERTEVSGGDISGGRSGEDLWYQWSTMFDQQFPMNHASQGFGVIDQWHDQATSSPPVSFNSDVADGYWGLVVSRQSSPGKFIAAYRLWKTPFDKGKWQDIKIHIKWSEDNNVGFVELWKDGVRQTFTGAPCAGQTHCTVQTMTPGGGGSTYFKQGIYRDAAVNGVAVVYQDGYVVARREAGLGSPF